MQSLAIVVDARFGEVVRMLDKFVWRFEKAPATDRVLEQIEKQFAITLPTTYKKLVKLHNGGRPHPNVVKSDEHTERVIKTFLTVHPTKGGLRDVHDWLNDQLPEKCIPFASDPFGNYFCFHYGKATEEPSIIFWNHEQKRPEVLATSFQHFLEKF